MKPVKLDQPIVLNSADEIAKHLTELLTVEFKIKAESINPDSKLVEDLRLDSIDLCDSLIRLEEETGKSFPLEQFREVVTFSDFVTKVSSIALEK